MRSGNGHAGASEHEFAERFSVRNDGETALNGGRELRVAGCDGGGVDDEIAIFGEIA